MLINTYIINQIYLLFLINKFIKWCHSFNNIFNQIFFKISYLNLSSISTETRANEYNERYARYRE